MDMSYVVIIIGIILLLRLFYFLLNNHSQQVSNIIVILLIMYDWIFIHLTYSLPSNIAFILKSFGEILIFMLTFLLIGRLSYNKCRIHNIDYIFCFFIIIPFVISLVFGSSLSNMALSGYKDFFFPYILSYLLFKSKYLNFKYNVLNYITVIITSGAIIQTLLYDGNLSSLWFYKSFERFDENPIETGFYNYLKDDSLRATSIFVTPIDLSITTGLLCIYHLSQIMMRRNNRIIQLILMIYAFVGLCLSQTRVGFAFVAIGIATLIYTKKSRSVSFKTLLTIPILFIIATFGFMVNGKIDDGSALGRLIQYAEFFNSFSLLGYGIGDYDAIYKYDSFLLCSARMMGIAALLYFIMYFKLLKYVIKNYRSYRVSQYAPFIIASSTSLIYAFVFQHLAGSIALTLVIIFMFDFIYNPSK